MVLDTILVINAGSSSHKCSLFGTERFELLWEAHLEWKENFRDAHLTASDIHGKKISQKITIASTREGLKAIFESLKLPAHIVAVGHRVVHGGEKFIQTTRITPEVKKTIGELSYLAPLHNPANLEGIEAAEKHFGDLPQFAVFDTAFHATLPEEALTYPIPYEWRKKGIRRYGFHGISHHYCAKRAAELVGRPLEELRIINCHLGAGCSLAAIKGGKSIDTTMGFTPLEGLMMASRSGTIDPGIIFYLINHLKMQPEMIEKALNSRSGLLGVSGSSEDMRDIIQESSKGKKQSELALNVFLHRLRSFIGAMTASLQGIDLLVFAAGIGENSAFIREKTCEGLAYLGIELQPRENAKESRKDWVISTPKSRVQVAVVHTQEDLAIARECIAQLSYRP